MPNSPFVITQEETSDATKLILQGRMDAINAAELERRLQTLQYNERTNIILNMFLVEYLCSGGIRVILKAYKTISASGGKFGIEEPSECVKNVLGIVALDEMLINR